MTNGFGNPRNYAIRALEPLGDYLYAGTQHYEGAGLPNEGAEIWRSADGTNWTKVGDTQLENPLNNYVDALAGFDGYLYAYGSAGEVWRCQACAGADWERVVAGGLGNADSRGMAALEVYDGRLYAFVQNNTQGLTGWRTSDGLNWEAYGLPGFGNSNNVGPYGDGSVAVHNGRLYVGATNSRSGVSIWEKTVTADFTATPRFGVPPLTVQFNNASAGDSTTSEWDFGDGEKSTETNPTHTYTQVGTYSVTLKVGDGVDTDTVTKPAYVDTRPRMYLPLVVKLSNVYDDFNNPAYAGLLRQESMGSDEPRKFPGTAERRRRRLSPTAISPPTRAGDC